jgi:hypothetical protein
MTLVDAFLNHVAPCGGGGGGGGGGGRARNPSRGRTASGRTLVAPRRTRRRLGVAR